MFTIMIKCFCGVTLTYSNMTTWLLNLPLPNFYALDSNLSV